MKFVAFVVKGIENIALMELEKSLDGFQLIEHSDKLILFEADYNLNQLAQLRTIDDIGMFISKLEAEENFHEQIIKEISSHDLSNLKGKLETHRKLDNTFSITLSVAGSNINKEELVAELKSKIEESYNWEYIPQNHDNFDIRIFIDKSICFISLRLFKESLMHRNYKKINNFGALRPTVAAAMVALTTQGKTNLRVVDNFCGSGTILCESFSNGNDVYGGDIEKENIGYTLKNLNGLGFKKTENIKHQDAQKTKFQKKYFDAAISNIPWNNQIKVSGITELINNSLLEYKRVLKPAGQICILTTDPQIVVKYIKKYFPNKKVETIKLGLLGNSPTIVYSN